MSKVQFKKPDDVGRSHAQDPEARFKHQVEQAKATWRSLANKHSSEGLRIFLALEADDRGTRLGVEERIRAAVLA